MRTPRPQDFAPNTKRVIQPEKLDVADVTPIQPKIILQQEVANSIPVRPVRSENKTEVYPENESVQKREIKRHAFEIYRDQLETLKQMKMKLMMQGNSTSMSEMVRQAIDTFIQDNKST